MAYTTYMDKADKIRKIKKWFNAYKDLFIKQKETVNKEQIEVYNEMALIIGEQQYKPPQFKYEKVLVKGEYVMRQVKI